MCVFFYEDEARKIVADIAVHVDRKINTSIGVRRGRRYDEWPPHDVVCAKIVPKNVACVRGCIGRLMDGDGYASNSPKFATAASILDICIVLSPS